MCVDIIKSDNTSDIARCDSSVEFSKELILWTMCRYIADEKFRIVVMAVVYIRLSCVQGMSGKLL